MQNNKEDIQQKVSDLLSPYANQMEDERLGVFLTLSVGRVLLNNKDAIDKPIDAMSLSHITDWLKASIINNEKWITNLNDKGYPKKLMKFSSINQIHDEADKAMLINAQKLSNVKLIEGDEKLFTVFQDGYYLVQLLTPNALDRESGKMQHCIGEGAYDDNLNNEDVKYLSLRDSSNNPHATIALIKNSIVELQGKQNRAPIQKYMDILIPYIKEQGFDCSKLPIYIIQHVIDDNGKWIKYDEIPDNMTFTKTLDFNGLKLNKLPENLNMAKAPLILKNTTLKKLPRGLKVCFLDISGVEINELPDDMEITGSLVLNDTKIKYFPSNINKIHILFATNSSLVALADGLEITKSAFLDSTLNLVKLPDGFKVKTSLNLRNSALKVLPKRLDVGILDIRFSAINELPEDIIIRNSLSIDNTAVKKLPDKIKRYNRITATESQLEELPNNLTVENILNVFRCPINKLPKGLKVGEILNIQSTKIRELPDDLDVKKIRIDINQLSHIPSSIIKRGTLFSTFNGIMTGEELNEYYANNPNRQPLSNYL